MKRILYLIPLLAVLCYGQAFASTTNVTATLTDSDGVAWANCSWSAVVTSPIPPTISGVPVPASSLIASGTCSASGVLTATMLNTSSVQPVGAAWTFTIQPNASVPPSIVPGISVIGTTLNLSSVLSSAIKAPRFEGGPNSYGYSNVEVISGNTYFNTGSVGGYCNLNLAGWVCGGGGGGGTPGGSTGSLQYNNAGAFGGFSGTGIPKLNGAGAPTLAVADTDFPSIASVTAAQTTANNAVVNTPSAVKASLQLSINRSSGGNEFYGDSLVAFGTGIGDFGNSPQMGARLANDLLGPSSNWAVGGTQLSAMVDALFLNHLPNYSSTALTTVFTDGGVNEANFVGAGTGAINNFQNELSAFVSWAQLPMANRVMASAATTSGTWIASSTLPLSPLVTGTARSSTTNGSTLTFSVTGTGTKLGITYYVPVSANGGTFTFSIDGTPQTDVCSGTTTFANTGCNSQAIAGASITAFRQEFTVASGAHTAVVTVTSATSASNIVYISSVDQTPSTKVGLPILIHLGVIRQQNDTNPTITSAYNTAVQTVFTNLSWANTFFVDTRTGTPGVNATTDMAGNGNAWPCPAGSPPLHPNKCGYDDWVTTVENTPAIAALGIFYPGINTPAYTIMGNQLVQGNQTVTGTSTAQTYNSPILTTTRLGQSGSSWLTVSSGSQLAGPSSFLTPLCFVFTNVDCIGQTFDVTNSAQFTAIISEFEAGIQFCPHGVASGSITTGPTGCSNGLVVNPTTKTATFYGNIQVSATAPTIAAGAAAGTAPTGVSVTGTSAAFTVNLTTGTSPATSSSLATITFANAYTVAPRFSCTAHNAASALAATALWVDSTTSTAILNIGATALTASTAYTWYCVNIG